MTTLKVLVLLIFKIFMGKLLFENDVIMKKIWDFQHFGNFQINVAYPCLYWNCSSSLDSESNSKSAKQSDYTWSSNCPSLLPIAVLSYSGSRYRVFWLEALVYLMVASAAPYFLLPSLVTCRKDNLGPNHIFLLSDWQLALLPSTLVSSFFSVTQIVFWK